MDKEKYLLRLSKIDSSIRELQAEKARLRIDYIRDNAQFKIGEKVIIRTVRRGIAETGIIERFAFVTGFKVFDPDGDITPTLRKAKKDGTVGIKKDSIWGNEEIVKIQ